MAIITLEIHFFDDDHFGVEDDHNWDGNSCDNDGDGDGDNYGDDGWWAWWRA
jgi:hypothetical protein